MALKTMPIKGCKATALVETLENEIVTGVLQPGARLSEVALAERFGVSRTPVREAFLSLASSGLIELRPRRSVVVASIPAPQLVEMFEVMAILEGSCGRLAAQRMTKSELRSLGDIHLRCRRAVERRNPEDYYALNVNFHEAVYTGSHNEFLVEQTRRLRNRLAPYRRLQLRCGDRIDQSFAEHKLITEAIVEQNPDRAESLLLRHVLVQSGVFHEFLSDITKPQFHEAGNQ